MTTRWVALVLGASIVLMGCEDERRRKRGDDDDDGPLGGSAGMASGGAGGGFGGAGASGGAGAVGGGSAGGPTECVYPTGPYDVEQGATVPPSLTWQGFAPGASTPSTITIQDFFDCDGTRGIDAVLIDTSQYG